jgi:hypothetical protein
VHRADNLVRVSKECPVTGRQHGMFPCLGVPSAGNSVIYILYLDINSTVLKDEILN